MKKIITFNNFEEFHSYIGENTSKEGIREDLEGWKLLSKDGESLYKVYGENKLGGWATKINKASKVLTTEDINMKLYTYIFPEELYAIEDNLIGFKRKAIKRKDLFNPENIKELYNPEKTEKTEVALLRAYSKILKETDRLSKKEIEIFDLRGNLMYTGNCFYGIDTIGFAKTEEKSSLGTGLYCHNKESLIDAIKCGIEQGFERYFSDKELVSEMKKLSEEQDMERYTKGLMKLVKSRK